MRRLALSVGILVAGALLVTEASMQPTDRDRLVLAGVYLLAAIATVGVFLGVRAYGRRIRRLATTLQLVTIGSAAVVAVAVVLAAQSMFLSEHDRNLVLIALVLGLGLGSALAVALGDAASRDVARLQHFASRVAEGEFDGSAGVDRADEIGDLARSLERMGGRLAATDDERKVLLASIGHDLRTPLAAMRAQLEAFQDGVVTDAASLVDGLARDVEHLSRLVEDLFLFARMEAGTMTMTPETVDLVELVDEAVEAMGPVAARRGVDVCTTADSPVAGEVDAWAFGRVLRNLLDNAIRHAPEDGNVTVNVGAGEKGTRIVVVDDGPGFSRSIRERAFERFTRGDPARRPDHGGSGLGLAIARMIVEAHGGTIGIEDGPGGRVAISL